MKPWDAKYPYGKAFGASLCCYVNDYNQYQTAVASIVGELGPGGARTVYPSLYSPCVYFKRGDGLLTTLRISSWISHCLLKDRSVGPYHSVAPILPVSHFTESKIRILYLMPTCPTLRLLLGIQMVRDPPPAKRISIDPRTRSFPLRNPASFGFVEFHPPDVVSISR